MDELQDFLRAAVATEASDIFITAGLNVSYKKDGQIRAVGTERVTPDVANALVTALYELAGRPMTRYVETGDDDFSVSVPGLSRFRVSTYKQRGSMAAVVRVVTFEIPDYHEMMIPESVIRLSQKTQGLILVTGTAGSGKSTTLACITDEINKTRNAHIITIEDPIEHLHRNKLSVVSQREVSTDTMSYISALRACLRQAPDVIILGEMRDTETIKTAMTAAETGHLVISTLHTIGAANTVDRVIDVFPPEQQQQIRVQLAMVLQTVISQQLVPCKTGGLIPAFEIMNLNSAIRSLIRDNKIHQIDSVIQSSAAEGMIAMDDYLINMLGERQITTETAIKYAINIERMERKLGVSLADV